MKISILGLGYVGAVSAACFAKEGNTVIGVDVNPLKVNLINEGKSPIVEEGLEELIHSSVSNKNLESTFDIKHAVHNSEISFICVGTPSMKNGSLDLKYIFKVIEQIAYVLKSKDEYHIIVIRSTILPGTIDECYSKMKNILGDRNNYTIVSNPEFLREGTAIKDFYDPPYTIVGTNDETAKEKMKELYSFLDAPFHSVDTKIAEMMKYANNSFHALKICFANEIGNICKELKIDGHEVMNLVSSDKKLNLSSYYLKPGFAFGGSCLPKDLRAITSKAKLLNLSSPVLENILPSNEFQIKRGIDLIKETGKRKIGILGLAFKANTDDLRESPIVEMTEYLIGKGFEIFIYDNNVNISFLTGSNKEYIEQHLPHFLNYFTDDLEKVISNSDVLVIGNKNEEFKKIVNTNPEKIIIDLVRIDKEKISGDNYTGICW